MNNNNTLEATINEIIELEAMADELRTLIDSLKDSVKSEMSKLNVETFEIGTHIVRWTPVLSNRFDSVAFKKVMPDVYKSFTKQIASRKFTIA